MFQIKYNVKELVSENKRLDKKIIISKDNIHVLKAEWSYLIRHQRLLKLKNIYFKNKYTDTPKIYSINDYKEQN